ncbi:1,4-dihydroxy-2-naphthoate polyprenyltransferase [Aciduricibacillus chroicocephali]|uniref:1,4-dihydroxy-2-naphthoate octaprenyltransferase n=1 Tax=Aciduricibacillus chroicocephali TaxID=3054939 RepID=A0ABY9KSW6_9BACI|nr:1,4-dihydroxy-2-naphthoate polyprenyltransferase [Bacillaceae bacterium 44XB]
METTTSVKDALKERDGLHIWWRMLRPHTLTASFVPVFVGSMAAWTEGKLHVFLFIAMLLASILIQAATNMFNEYYDFVRGLDTDESVGISGTIVRDGLAPKTVLRTALIFYSISILLGVFICVESSWWIAVVGLVCMLFGYLYTGGPYPIAYTPFGELFAGFFMGTVIIGISYFIQTSEVNARIVLISIPVAFLIGSILLANNIRDLDGDRENGRKTIAILLGRKNAIGFLGLLFAAAYLWTIVLVIVHILPLWSLIVIFSAPKAYKAYSNFRGKTKPLEMFPAMIATGKTNSMFGILLGLSLLIDHFIG